MTAIERIYQASVEELWDLWTTKDGFESWWGPQDFRADVHRIEARVGGALHYDMVANTPAMVEAMRQMGRPASHPARATFAEFVPHRRLVLRSAIDFLPGVEPYDNDILVEFAAVPGGRARMTVTLTAGHDPSFSAMQREGFLSQLSKLDRRYGWQG